MGKVRKRPMVLRIPPAMVRTPDVLPIAEPASKRVPEHYAMTLRLAGRAPSISVALQKEGPRLLSGRSELAIANEYGMDWVAAFVDDGASTLEAGQFLAEHPEVSLVDPRDMEAQVELEQCLVFFDRQIDDDEGRRFETLTRAVGEVVEPFTYVTDSEGRTGVWFRRWSRPGDSDWFSDFLAMLRSSSLNLPVLSVYGLLLSSWGGGA